MFNKALKRLNLFLLLIFLSYLSSSILYKRDIKLFSPTINQDSLLFVNNKSIFIKSDESYDFRIDKEFLFWNDGVNVIATGDLSFSWLVNQNLNQIIDSTFLPEKINLYNSESKKEDLKNLARMSFYKIGEIVNIENLSWWKAFVEFKETRNDYNKYDPNQYIMPKDDNGRNIDDRTMGLFHQFMENKVTREFIYDCIKINYNILEKKLTKFQKLLIEKELNKLIYFCENYYKNRNIYLNGRNKITEIPGDINPVQYGYNTVNEGFLFRRFEYNKIPPKEISNFLIELKQEVNRSLNNSQYYSNIICNVNNGKLLIFPFLDNNYQMGFMLKSNKNSNKIFIPYEFFSITRISISGNDYWRIKDIKTNQFITFNENLIKIP